LLKSVIFALLSPNAVSLWNRSLNAAEVANLYKRGGLYVNLSVKQCRSADCTDRDWQLDVLNSTRSNLSAIDSGNYFQYKANLFSNSLVYSPELLGVTIHYTNSDYSPDFTRLISTSQTDYGIYDTGYQTANVFYNSTIGAAQQERFSPTGTYTSPAIDLSADKQFVNISYTTGAYYESEIGRGQGDSATPPTENDFNRSVNTSGLVLLYHFNNETAFGESNANITDFSNYVNSEKDGQPQSNGYQNGGMTMNGTPKLGSHSAWFDGTNDHINAGSNPSLTTSKITVSAWVYLDNITQAKGIVGKWASPNYPWLLWFSNTPANFSFVINNAAYIYSTNTQPNRWYHVVGTYDLVNVKLYVDGVVAMSKAYSSPMTSTTRSVIIGKYSNGADGSTLLQPFVGNIDEVAIWNRSLSQAEITNLYKRGAMRLNLSVRSCSSPDCTDSGYNVNATNSTGTSLSTLTNNRYIQYQANFFSNSTQYQPELYNVTIHYANIGGGGDTCSCPASGDWNILCSDNCIIGVCNMQNNKVTIIGTSGFAETSTTGRIYNWARFANHGCKFVCRNTNGCTT